MSYSEPLSRPHTTPKQAPEQNAVSEGMSFAALLGWGLVALFVVVLLSGLVK